MIGCLRTRVRRPPIIALYFEFETVLKFYNLEARCCLINDNTTMVCPLVRGDKPRALASGLCHVQLDQDSITISYHLYQSRPCALGDIAC